MQKRSHWTSGYLGKLASKGANIRLEKVQMHLGENLTNDRLAYGLIG